ncbi:MAG TPA: WecB/TagA/CpsF family glycosyltransferase [Caldimonas sp.]|nr:WecB/TagA/CpsF family glycosyltransferase [Caldimonas sp.]
MSAPACPRASARFARDVVCLAGLPFDPVDLQGAVDRLREAVRTRTRCFVSTPNLNFVMAARRDAVFRDSVLRSDLSLADGAPLVWMARALGLSIPGRVAGADVFEALRRHPGEPIKVFFFGGPPGAAEAAYQRLSASTTGLRAVGFDAAGYGSVEDMSTAAQLERINSSGAEFVVVSLGAAKGQAWIEHNAASLDAPLLCHMGAVVNFVAGRVKRAPRVLQELGLEWVWRIKEEPALWTRYLRDGIGFAGLVLRQAPFGARGSHACDSTEPWLECTQEPSSVSIRLGGGWSRSALAPLRVALARAAHGDRAVRVDMALVTAVDAWFLGLMLLARGSFGPGRFAVMSVPASVRADFRRHGADYLADAAP